MPSLTNLSTPLLISVYLKRDIHENGMTLAEYANAVIAGPGPAAGQTYPRINFNY